MASTQKIILSVIMINLLIVLLPALMEAKQNYQREYAELQLSNIIKDAEMLNIENINTNETYTKNIGTSVNNGDIGIWDAIKLSVRFAGVLFRGLVPFGTVGYIYKQGGQGIETMIALMLGIFRLTLAALLALEAYLLFVNRKTGG